MSESGPLPTFSPGKGIRGVSNAPKFFDAADILQDSNDSIQSAKSPGILLLADGTRYEGQLFGAEKISKGELVFTTGMCGYQESLTDPSFAGQVLTFTYPLIGNYGIIPGISESSKVHPRGVICRHQITYPDNRESIGSINQFLAAHGVPGIEGIDTRSLTRRVREYGTLLCVFGPIEKEIELQRILNELTPPDKEDLVAQVTCNEEKILNEGAIDSNGNRLPRIAVIDCGIKYNILRKLCSRFEVIWCPANSTFDGIKERWNPSAFFASNGPGDPAHPGFAASARRILSSAIMDDMPVMGICLGHQLMGLNAGLKTYKLRYGHRGSNQPVMDLESGRIHITSQNHGFAVEDPIKGILSPHPSRLVSNIDETPMDVNFKVRYVNSNDGTVEGLDLIDKPVFTIQFHPESCPGPHDASPLFDRFQELVSNYMINKSPLIQGGR